MVKRKISREKMKELIRDAIIEANANMRLEGYHVTHSENEMAEKYLSGESTLEETVERIIEDANRR